MLGHGSPDLRAGNVSDGTVTESIVIIKRGNGLSRPTLPRWPDADSAAEELEALEDEIEVEVPVDNLHEPRPIIDNLHEARTMVDNLDEPQTPVRNPHVAMSGGSPPRKRSRRRTRWGTPAEKELNNTRKCVVSRAYKAAVSEARKSGASEEEAARAGREAFAVAAATYEEHMARPE